MSSWNISKSIEHLSTHVESKSVGRCARYVRQAIEAGGLDTNGHPGSAYQYKRYLPTKGFNAIGNITGREKQAAWTKLNAQVGDISVMEHGEHGHICMWNGSKWISDFAQNNMWPYRGDGTCTIFRFGGHVDGNLEPYNGKISSNPNATNIGGTDLSGLKWETKGLETIAKGNGIEYKITKDGEVNVTISESDLGGDATDGTIYSMPRYTQQDNVLFSTLCSIKKNILKEIFESANILFDESDRSKQNITDLIEYKQAEQYNISNNTLVKETINIIDSNKTNKNISNVKLGSNPNIRYKNTLFGDSNLTISEGIIIKLHIDNNLFEGATDALSDIMNGMGNINVTGNAKVNKEAFESALNEYGSVLGLNKTGICVILGQVAHESGNFKYWKEIGAGKGRKYGKPAGPYNQIYYGRGPIQVTWYENYKKIYETFFKKAGLSQYDIVKNPDLALDPKIGSLLSMGFFMLPGNGKKAVAAANAGNVKSCTRYINGGYNGLEDRQRKTLAYAKDMGVTVNLNA